MPRLASACYGKDNVRVYKVHRDYKTGVQTVTEMTVTCLLEGQVGASYTEADNTKIVATDSIKNTIYIKAKEHPVNPPELFASILGHHFLDRYAHMSTAHVKIVVHRWTRMVFDGKPHPHSFHRDGQETRNVEATASRAESNSVEFAIRSCIAGLTVLKSTGSAFHGFVRDEFTTLGDTWDRIFSTDIECSWTWKTLSSLAAVQEGAAERFDRAWEKSRAITMRTFAEEESPSVQNTVYKMCEKILEEVPEAEAASFSLPNRHYFEIDLSWHNELKNTGTDAEVCAPQSAPNGLIQCEVVRS